jgi:hypothetical protein
MRRYEKKRKQATDTLHTGHMRQYVVWSGSDGIRFGHKNPLGFATGLVTTRNIQATTYRWSARNEITRLMYSFGRSLRDRVCIGP